MARQPNGQVVIGGQFTRFNGTNRSGIARINQNGSLDTTFDAGSVVNPAVRALVLQPDRRVIIGGDFVSVNSLPRWRIARLLSAESAIPLEMQRAGNQLVLSWTNAAFGLQSAPAITGPFTNLPAATSPYTNPLTAAQQYFRLMAN